MTSSLSLVPGVVRCTDVRLSSVLSSRLPSGSTRAIHCDRKIRSRYSYFLFYPTLSSPRRHRSANPLKIPYVIGGRDSTCPRLRRLKVIYHYIFYGKEY